MARKTVTRRARGHERAEYTGFRARYKIQARRQSPPELSRDRLNLILYHAEWARAQPMDPAGTRGREASEAASR